MGKKRILIVDDLYVNRELLKKILSDEYEIDEASNGHEACELFEKNAMSYSLIITDNHMPVMSGLEFIEKISVSSWFGKIPVIMTSSDRDEAFVLHAYELGVTDFLFVPYSVPVVKKRIENTLRLQEQHERELQDALQTITEMYYIIVRANLTSGRCRVIDMSSDAAQVKKNMPTSYAEGVRIFIEGGFIHSDDIETVIEFLSVDNIREHIAGGEKNIYLKYRRKSNNSYGYAMLAVKATDEYSEDNQLVIISSKDIEEDVVGEIDETVVERAIAEGCCNLTQNVFSNNGKQSSDKVTDVIKRSVEHIKNKESKERFLEKFDPENLIKEYEEGHTRTSVEYVAKRQGGGIGLFRTTAQTFKNNYSNDIGAVYYSEEITEDYIQKKIQELLYDYEYEFFGLIEVNKRRIYVNKTKLDVLKKYEGKNVDYYEGTELFIDKFIDKRDSESYRNQVNIAAITNALKNNIAYEFSVNCTGKEGKSINLQHVYQYFDVENSLILCMFRNISKFSELDSITGGINRAGFEKRVRQIFTYGSEHTEKMSLIHFDIKEFKAINGILGYEAGNYILKEVYDKILYSGLKPIVIARVMADQFVCLVRSENVNTQVITELCKLELIESGKPVKVRMQCGIYEIENTLDPIHTMSDKARLAEKYIKNDYVMPYAFYEKSMNDSYIEKTRVMNRVFSAMDNHEFKAYYQPIFDAKTHEIVSAEALVRWIHPKEGMISPGVFIPALEEKGDISQLDLYIYRSVQSFLEGRKRAGKFIVPVSTNLSRMDFFNQEMLQSLIEDVSKTELDKKYVRFELTESAFVDVNYINDWALDELKDMKVKLLVDDFGTGYSSLVNLSANSFDIVKMDMSFVRNIGKNKATEAIIISVIEMVHRMGAKVIAEGVETEEQLEFLANNNCDYIQGYYFSKPLPEEEFEQMLEKYN